MMEIVPEIPAAKATVGNENIGCLLALLDIGEFNRLYGNGVFKHEMTPTAEEEERYSKLDESILSHNPLVKEDADDVANMEESDNEEDKEKKLEESTSTANSIPSDLNPRGTIVLDLDATEGNKENAVNHGIKPSAELVKIQSQILQMVKETIDKYEAAIHERVDMALVEIDDVYCTLTQELVERMSKSIHVKSGKGEILSAAVRAANLMMLQMKALLQDTINRWLQFYLKEVWIFGELGVTEFKTYQQYVYGKVKKMGANKIYLTHKLLRFRFKRYVQHISKRVGTSIFLCDMDFKNKVKRQVSNLNTSLEKCPALTPYVGQVELLRLRHEIDIIQSGYWKDWYIFKHGDETLVHAFFKSLYDNLDNTPEVEYEETNTPFTNASRDTFVLEPHLFSQAEILNAAEEDMQNEESVKEEMNGEHLGLTDDDKKEAELLFLAQQITNLISKEENDIITFLNAHPLIEQRRQAKMKEKLEAITNRPIEDIRYVVNEEGVMGKLVKFQGESEYILIRTDTKGNQTISKGVSNKWFHVDRRVLRRGCTVAHLVRHGKPVKIPMTSMALGTAAICSGSGALGCFLYQLVVERKKLAPISKGLVANTGHALVLNFMIATVPYITLTLAWMVGVKLMVDLTRNKLIKKRRKLKLVSTVVVKTGTTVGISMGTAAIGQALIPVPILGSFIGGVIGGFACSAFFSTYHNIVAKRVSLEVLFMYTLMKFHRYSHWDQLAICDQTLDRNKDQILSFLKVLAPYFVDVQVDVGAFHREIRKKEHGIFSVVDEMYSSVAYRPKHCLVNAEFETKWKTLIMYCFMSYYYFLLDVQLTDFVEKKKITEETKLHALEIIENLIDLQPVAEYILNTEGMHGHNRTYEKVICVTTELIGNSKLVTLFKQALEKTSIDEKKSKKKDKDAKIKVSEAPETTTPRNADAPYKQVSKSATHSREGSTETKSPEEKRLEVQVPGSPSKSRRQLKNMPSDILDAPCSKSDRNIKIDSSKSVNEKGHEDHHEAGKKPSKAPGFFLIPFPRR